MTNSVVPFGKYKGKPIEALREDKAYTDWLVAQDWFRTRYDGLFTIIVNNFGEASSTPEHNALQALFLQQSFAASVYDKVRPGGRTAARKEIIKNTLENIEFCKKRSTERAQTLLELQEYLEKLEHTLVGDVDVKFEVGGADVSIIDTGWHDKHSNIGYDGNRQIITYNAGAMRIEVKPSVGDDYPAVMRQMAANHCGVLFLEHYTGIGVTREQFIAIFAASHIKVVFRNELPHE
jgi:hypothetical protein